MERESAMDDLLYQLRDVLPSNDVTTSTPTPSLPDPSLDLLSPVSSASLPLKGFQHVDDSGFVDSTVCRPPLPQPSAVDSLNPPRSPLTTPKSTLDLISSSFGSPSLRISSPPLSGLANANGPISPLASAFPSPVLQPAASAEPRELDMDELDSPTTYNVEKHDDDVPLAWIDDSEDASHTAVFLGSQRKLDDSPQKAPQLTEPSVDPPRPDVVLPTSTNDQDEWAGLPPPEPSPMLEGIDDPFAREPSPFPDLLGDQLVAHASPFLDASESSTFSTQKHGSPTRHPELSQDVQPQGQVEDATTPHPPDRSFTSERHVDLDDSDEDEGSHSSEDDSFHCTSFRMPSPPAEGRPSSSFSLSTERAEGASSPSPSVGYGMEEPDNTFGFGAHRHSRSRSASPSEPLTPSRPPRPPTPLYDNSEEQAEIESLHRASGSYEFIHQDPSSNPRVARFGRSSSRNSSRCSTPTPLPDLIEEDEPNLSSEAVNPQVDNGIEDDDGDYLSGAPSSPLDEDATAFLAYTFRPPGLASTSPQPSVGIDESAHSPRLSGGEDATVQSRSPSSSESEPSSPDQEEYFTAHPEVTTPLDSTGDSEPDPSLGDRVQTSGPLFSTPRLVSTETHGNDNDGHISPDNSPSGTSLNRTLDQSDDRAGPTTSDVGSPPGSPLARAEDSHDAHVSFSSSSDDQEELFDEEVCMSLKPEDMDETLHAFYDVYSSSEAEDEEDSEDLKSNNSRRLVFSPPETSSQGFKATHSASISISSTAGITQRPLFTPEPSDSRMAQRRPRMDNSGDSLPPSPSPLSATPVTSLQQGRTSSKSPTTPTAESSFEAHHESSQSTLGSNTTPPAPQDNRSSSPRGKGLKPLRLSLSLVDPNASATSVLDFPLPPTETTKTANPARQRDSLASVSSSAHGSWHSISHSSEGSLSSLPKSNAIPSTPPSSKSPSSLSLSPHAFDFALLSKNASSIPVSHSTPNTYHNYHNRSSSSPRRSRMATSTPASPSGGLHPPIIEDEEPTIKSTPVRKQVPPRLALDFASPSNRVHSPTKTPLFSSDSVLSLARAAGGSSTSRTISQNSAPAGRSHRTFASESVSSVRTDYRRPGSAGAALRDPSGSSSPVVYLPTPSTTRSQSTSPLPSSRSHSPCPSPFLTDPSTPRPTLLFALASDDPQRVVRALVPDPKDGSDNMRPTANDTVPAEPGSELLALDYALYNSDKLLRWRSILSVLLGFGATPSHHWLENGSLILRYYLNLAREESTLRLLGVIHSSRIFSPLGRLRFEMIGQQRVFEVLFRGLRRWEVMRERDNLQKRVSKPVVMMLCGLSAHGKTMMAQKFGEALDCPTHVVDLASVQSTTDLWASLSTLADDEVEPEPLSAFLERNKQRRSVVVLDEMDKLGSESALWALLKPWDNGKCSVSSSSTIDVRNTIFIATSNIGQGICGSQEHETPSEQDYEDIVKACRVEIIERLGSFVESRIPIVLPFLPFTDEEKVAVAGDAFATLSIGSSGPIPQHSETMLLRALEDETLVSGDARELWRIAERFSLDI